MVATAEKPRKKAKDDDSPQMDLIDVDTEEGKEVAKIARQYKKQVRMRQDVLTKEIDLKKKLLAFVKSSNIPACADGTWKFKVDGVTVSIEPRDEVVRIKADKDEDAGE